MMNFNNDDYQNRNQDRQFVREQQYDRNYGNYAPQKPELDFEPKKEKSSGGGFMNFIWCVTGILLLAALVMDCMTRYIKWKKGQKPKEEEKPQVKTDEASEEISTKQAIELLVAMELLKRQGIQKTQTSPDPETAHRQFRDATLNSMQTNGEESEEQQIGFIYPTINDDTENNTGTGGDNSDNGE